MNDDNVEEKSRRNATRRESRMVRWDCRRQLKMSSESD